MRLNLPLEFFLVIDESHLPFDDIPWPSNLDEVVALTQHAINSIDKRTAIMVYFPDSLEMETADVISTLVHESVHVFDFMMDHYGETVIGSETRAYSVENIFSQLFDTYATYKKEYDERKK